MENRGRLPCIVRVDLLAAAAAAVVVVIVISVPRHAAIGNAYDEWALQ